jgi:hypothetical protein
VDRLVLVLVVMQVTQAQGAAQVALRLVVQAAHLVVVAPAVTLILKLLAAPAVLDESCLHTHDVQISLL